MADQDYIRRNVRHGKAVASVPVLDEHFIYLLDIKYLILVGYFCFTKGKTSCSSSSQGDQHSWPYMVIGATIYYTKQTWYFVYINDAALQKTSTHFW